MAGEPLVLCKIEMKCIFLFGSLKLACVIINYKLQTIPFCETEVDCGPLFAFL